MNLNHIDLQNGGEVNIDEEYVSGDESFGYPSSYESYYGGLNNESNDDLDDLSISSNYNEGYQSGGAESSSSNNHNHNDNNNNDDDNNINDVLKNKYITLIHILHDLHLITSDENNSLKQHIAKYCLYYLLESQKNNEINQINQNLTELKYEIEIGIEDNQLQIFYKIENGTMNGNQDTLDRLRQTLNNKHNEWMKTLNNSEN